MSQPDPAPRTRATFLARWLPAIGIVAGFWLLLSRKTPSLVETAGSTMALSDPSGRGSHTDGPSGAALAAGHETGDINALTMAKLAAGLLVGAAIVMGGMVLLNRWLHHTSVAEQPGLTAAQTAAIPPPPPNLQADPPADLARLRGFADALLDSYAWIDSSHTRARIPIQRAMALMVGRPLETPP